MVLSADGKQLRVKWIGRQTVSNTAAIMNPPVMIHKDALGEGKPHSNLHVTAAHGMYIDGLVINAGALVNNDTIAFMSWNQLPKTVTYYHIETENHELIVANGAETESYVDYISRQRFDNYDEYVALYGIETRIVEMPCHRISSRRLVPMAVLERLVFRIWRQYPSQPEKAKKVTFRFPTILPALDQGGLFHLLVLR